MLLRQESILQCSHIFRRDRLVSAYLFDLIASNGLRLSKSAAYENLRVHAAVLSHCLLWADHINRERWWSEWIRVWFDPSGDHCGMVQLHFPQREFNVSLGSGKR